MPRGHRTTARTILLLLALGAAAGTASAAPPEKILFPVVGRVSYSDDFGAPRGGHSHQGNDIMAPRRSPVVAVEAGRIERPSWSSSDCALILHGKSGTDYWYLHLNDDLTSGDDNGGRKCQNGVAYAPGLVSGQRVRAGQLIAYVGNSGNAAGVATHLHFELHPDGGGAVSPYRWLRSATRLLYAAPATRTSVRLALEGSLTSMDRGVSVHVGRVAVAGEWRGRVSRSVSLSLAPATLVERLSARGKVRAAGLAGAKTGERVTVWTTWFPPSLRTQLAGPNALTAAKVRLRGLAR